MSELTDWGVIDCLNAVRSGQISSIELTRAFLQRSEQLNPSLNAFITLAAEQALIQADAADQRRAEWRKDPGALYPPLLGLPLAVKDVLCVKGMHCTCGSRILEGFTPPYDATVVERLRAAGAVILGKTNTDEFAMGSSTENSAFGVTHNPWDLTRVPGGSSGGSAAAVAAHLAPAGLGTDTGGSVRQPASFCNLTGLKPTYGRLSRYGLVAFGSSLDVVGILARSVADVVPLLRIMAGVDQHDTTSLDCPVPEVQLEGGIDLTGLRVGVPEEYFISGIQPEVERAVRAAIDVLRSLGAQVQPVSLPYTEYALPVYYLIAPSEASANLARYDGVRYGPRLPAGSLRETFDRTRGQGFGAEVKRRIMLGTYVLSEGYYQAYYAQAQKVRALIQQDFAATFEAVDVIAAPVSPTTAFKIGAHADDPLAMYLEDIFTLPASLAGLPGLAFPAGFDTGGLPVGMQLIGRRFEEGLLLRTAHAYQQNTDWHRHSPSL